MAGFCSCSSGRIEVVLCVVFSFKSKSAVEAFHSWLLIARPLVYMSLPMAPADVIE